MTTSSQSPGLVERLAEHRTVGRAPLEELQWLADHGRLREWAPGDVIVRAGDPVSSFYITLTGRYAIQVDRGFGPRKVMEWSAGDVGGLLPYSRLAKAPGDVMVSETCTMLMIESLYFPEMILKCPWVTATLVHVMIDRARVFTSSDLQDEKMASLGRLAAGLAHELNNPASAAARSATRLEEGLERAETASRALGAARLSPDQQGVIDDVRRICLERKPGTLGAMERADWEEGVAAWLHAHGLKSETAGELTDACASVETLEQLARALPAAAVGTAIEWIAANCAIHSLVTEVQRASSRIHHLVAAVKRFTYMDKPGVPEPVDIEQGLRDTALVLGSKSRAKNITVAIEIEPGLPRAYGFGGELNQVWSNLLDNALDAAPVSGNVTISAAPAPGTIVVSVVDDGPGIPAEIRGRIFDPFFTTKPVGQGTGLGLEISMKLVRHNGGTLEVDSRPGRTEFRVTVPAM